VGRNAIGTTDNFPVYLTLLERKIIFANSCAIILLAQLAELIVYNHSNKMLSYRRETALQGAL